MDTCLREKLQTYLFEEMDTHFKRIEDNVIKRMEEIISLKSRSQEPVTATLIERQRYRKVASHVLNKVNISVQLLVYYDSHQHALKFNKLISCKHSYF